MQKRFILPCIFILISFFLSLSLSYAAKTNPTPERKEKNLSISTTLKEKQAKEHFQKGLEFSHSKKIDSAIQEYQKALELDPNFSMAYVNLGMSYILKKEFDKAIDELKKAIRKNPKLKIAHFNLWWAYRQQKKYDLGIEELNKIIQIDPNDANAYINIGDTYLSDKKLVSKAIDSYEKGLIRQQKNISLLQKLGKAYELNKEYTKAIARFQKAIDLKNDAPVNYLFLYISLRKAGKDSEAKSSLQKILTILKKDNLPSETRDIIKYLTGNISEAKLLGSQNPIILCQANYYIGMNYLFEKKFEKADQYLQQALKTDMFFVAEYEYAKIELNQLRGKDKLLE